MSKYTFEFKKKVVMAYLNGEGGKVYLAQKYGVSAPSNIKKWVDNYKSQGDEGLMRSRKQEKYSFEYKLRVVELYLTTEVSYQELAIREGIHNPAQICKWVNDFQIAGPDALRPRKRGRKNVFDKQSNKHKSQPIDTTPIDTSAEHVKHLEDELLKLRIENAYLKELRRLRLEEEALLKKQRESSTASEESSN